MKEEKKGEMKREGERNLNVYILNIDNKIINNSNEYNK